MVEWEGNLLFRSRLCTEVFSMTMLVVGLRVKFLLKVVNTILVHGKENINYMFMNDGD